MSDFYSTPPNPIRNAQRLCMTALLVIIAVATFVAVLSYLAGDRHVMYSSYSTG